LISVLYYILYKEVEAIVKCLVLSSIHPVAQARVFSHKKIKAKKMQIKPLI